MVKSLERIVQIGDTSVGEGYPPLFLADIGTFFNQDLDAGFRLIDQVASSGLTFLKGEILHDVEICLKTELEEIITTRDLQISRERYRKVIERKVISLDDYARLFVHARSIGMRLAMSVYDEEGLRFANAQKVEILKIASSNIVHRPLIARAASSNCPVIIDTGRSALREIVQAVEWFIEAGGNRLILEHSPPAPPAPASVQNLRMIRLLHRTFGCPSGLSDHHCGEEMLYAGIALGAHVVEKGICPDSLTKDQDVAHALPVSLLPEVITRCRNVFEAIFCGSRDLSGFGTPNPARMGLIAKRDIPERHVISEEDLTFAFPAVGVPVEHTDFVIGAASTRFIRRREVIRWGDIQLMDDGGESAR